MVQARSLFGWGCALLLGWTASAIAKEDDFLERLWADEYLYGFRLSPDGKHLLYREKDNDVSRIHTWEIATKRRSTLSSRQRSNLGGAVWVDSDDLALTEWNQDSWIRVMVLSYNVRLKKNHGSFNEPMKLSVADRSKDIAPSIISGIPTVENKVLVGVPIDTIFVDPRRRRESQGGGREDVYMLDVHTGEMELVAKNPGTVDLWMADDKGVVRLGYENFGERRVFYRDHAGEEFHVLTGIVPLGFLPGFETLLVATAEGRDTVGVRIYDPATRTYQSKVIGHPEFDLVGRDSYGIEVSSANLRRDQATGAIIGITYEGEKPGTLWFDPAFRNWQKAVDQRFPGMTNIILGLAADNETLVVHNSGDINPGKVLLWKPGTDEATVLFDTMPSIGVDDLHPIQPITFPSRDGTPIRAYLTLPKNAEARKPLPFINIVHGGPEARDTWGFDVSNREAQFWASEGFAVLQVNFRGSVGFGKEYHAVTMLNAAKYGVEDPVDGTRWAIAQGIADPARCIIAGASFGGYASMMIAEKEPELHALAMPAMGVYDWREMMRYDKEDYHPAVWEILAPRYQELIDNPSLADEWTPVLHAAEILRPVLIIHGTGDARVDIKQYDRMVAALKDADVDFETFKYTRGGHGFGEKEGWIAYYRAQRTFVQERLP